MEEIKLILLKIIKIMQVLVILGSSISFIYLGIMTYLKKFDEVKKNLPWILIGLAILIVSYSLPVIILSFLEVKEIPSKVITSPQISVSIIEENGEEKIKINPPPQSDSIKTSEENNQEESIQIEDKQPSFQTQETSKANDTKIEVKEHENTSMCWEKIKPLYVDPKIKNDVNVKRFQYIDKNEDVVINICIIGRSEMINFYIPDGQLHQALYLIGETVFKIKKRVPSIRYSQPEWFTWIYILDPKKDIFGRMNEIAKAFFVGVKDKSIFFYYYEGGLQAELNNCVKNKKIISIIAHEAAHALDLRTGGGNKFFSQRSDSPIYKLFIKTDIDTFYSLADFYSAKNGLCPSLRLDVAYLNKNLNVLITDPKTGKVIRKEKFIEWAKKNPNHPETPFADLFADMYFPFLVCDDINTNSSNEKVQKVLNEFINILKQHQLID